MRLGNFGDHMTRTSSYRESLLRSLEDPIEAIAYLNAGLEDSTEAFLKALKNVAQAHQMSRVAKGAGLQRETLYRSLSDQGNPTITTLSSILEFLGFDLTVKQKEKPSEEIEISGQAGPVATHSDIKGTNSIFVPKQRAANGYQSEPMMAEAEITEQLAGSFPMIAATNMAASAAMTGVQYGR